MRIGLVLLAMVAVGCVDHRAHFDGSDADTWVDCPVCLPACMGDAPQCLPVEGYSREACEGCVLGCSVGTEPVCESGVLHCPARADGATGGRTCARRPTH